MNDIVESRNRAMTRQGWFFGDKMSRIGHPFAWVDGDQQGYIYAATGVRAVLQAMSMFYEEYPTPAEIQTADFEQMRDHVESTLGKLNDTLAPFTTLRDEWQWHRRCTAMTRTQDYAFIKTFAKNLPARPVHLDIGPGLSSHAFYSLEGFESDYLALEASPHMYEAQRQVLRFLSQSYGKYFDPVEAENFSLSAAEIKQELNSKGQYRLKHVPSWFFPEIEKESVDFITATWVLNEVNHAGILWLMSHATRTIKPNGYIYIRDSANLKPARHEISYDRLLCDHGFEEVARLGVENRVNYFGIPRIFRKTGKKGFTFDELADEYLGKFAIVSHGGSYNQALEKAPKKI